MNLKKGRFVENKNHKRRLRHDLRNKRKKLSAAEQMGHACQVLDHLQNSQHFSACHHVALYIENDGELATQRIAQALWGAGKFCYLPLLPHEPDTCMMFSPWMPSSIMMANRFGILEPQCDAAKHIKGEALDCVYFPLVGFDEWGARIGMGGGFYDRTFTNKNQLSKVPLLIGLAHDIQKVAQRIPQEKWDIKLDGIVTETKAYICSDRLKQI